VLTIHALSSGTASHLTKVDDGDHRVFSVNLDLIEAVLDDGGGHGSEGEKR